MRAWLFLLFYVCSLKAKFSAVIQSPERMEATEGSAVRLQCQLEIVDKYCYSVLWTKVDLRTRKIIVLKNTSPNTSVGGKPLCVFCIENATVHDSGNYYCSVVHSSMTFIGSGTTVIVTKESRTGPSVDILLPRNIQTRIPLLCVVSGVVPSEVRVFWVIDGKVESGLTESLWTKDGEGTQESTQNLVQVRAEDWERGVMCTCVVEFAGKNTTKSVQNQGSSNLCVVLLYGALGGASLIIIIIVALPISVFIYRGCLKSSDGGAWEQRGPTESDQRHRSGSQGGRPVIDPSTTEVQYATLEEASLLRRK